MKPATHLKSLQALDLTIRLGSLKQAAAELAITPAAVGQRIRTLEEYLGLELLVRGRFGVRPTAALENALEPLRIAFENLTAATQALDFQRVLEIHIIADLDWAELWLQPRLDEFRTLFPNTLFCINGVGDVPMRPGKADCTVSRGNARCNDNLDTLYTDYFAPFGSRPNVERFIDPTDSKSLHGWPLIHLNGSSDEFGWPQWMKKFGYAKPEPAGLGIRFQHVSQAIEAVRADAGFIIPGLSLVVDDFDNLACTVPFPPKLGQWAVSPYQAVYNRQTATRPQVEQFRQWLTVKGQQTQNELSAFTTY